MWISSSSPASRHCWIVWAPCTSTHLGPAAVFARATALSMPSVTNSTVEPGRGQPSGTWWVTTKAGMSHGCRPPQPSARSNVRRPVSMAPTSATKPLRCSALGGETRKVMPEAPLAVGTSTSPEKYQSKTSATPSFASATYPSRDIDINATTLLILVLLRSRGGSSAVLRDSAGTHESSVTPWKQQPRSRTLGAELPSSRNSTRPITVARSRASRRSRQLCSWEQDPRCPSVGEMSPEPGLGVWLSLDYPETVSL